MDKTIIDVIQVGLFDAVFGRVAVHCQNNIPATDTHECLRAISRELNEKTGYDLHQIADIMAQAIYQHNEDAQEK